MALAENAAVDYLARMDEELGITQRYNRLFDQAAENLKGEIASGHYSGLEIMAITRLKMLQFTGSDELANTILRGLLLDEMESPVIDEGGRPRNLWEFHPNKYGSVQQLVRDEVGMSPTQQSIHLNLHKVVFPYVAQELGISVQEFWNRVQHSNAALILPYLVAVITGKPSKSAVVNTGVKALLEGYGADENGRRSIVVDLIQKAENAKSWNALQRELNPDPTPNIGLSVVRRNRNVYLLARLDDEFAEDQIELLARLSKGHLDFYYLNVQKGREAYQLQEIQELTKDE